jgi:ATP-dependent Lon protease
VLVGDVDAETAEVEAMRRAMLAQFDQYVKLNKKIPPEILDLGRRHRRGRPPGRHDRRAPAAQARAEAGRARDRSTCGQRLEHLLGPASRPRLDILQVEKRIRGRVKRQMEKSQREYYLNEQVKAIQKELGEGEEGNDLDELEQAASSRAACPRRRWPRPRPS